MWEKGSADAPEDVYVRYGLIIARASIGHMQAKLGKRAAAIEECSKALSLLNEMPDDPKNTVMRTARAEAYRFVGNAYTALASSDTVPADERQTSSRSARDMYQRSLDIYLDMQRRRSSPSQDASEQVALKLPNAARLCGDDLRSHGCAKLIRPGVVAAATWFWRPCRNKLSNTVSERR